MVATLQYFALGFVLLIAFSTTLFVHGQSASDLAQISSYSYKTDPGQNELPPENFRHRAHIAPKDATGLTNPIADLFTRKTADGSLEIVVAYRGTANLADWRVNLVDGAVLKPVPGLPQAKAHSGFVDEVNAINRGGLVRELSDIMRENCGKNGDCKISITGHSQGAGEAIIATPSIQKLAKSYGVNSPIRVVTTATPPSVDQQFVDWAKQQKNIQMDSYQHSKDLIHLTSAVGYKMPGNLHVVNVDCSGPKKCHHEDLYAATVKRQELLQAKNRCQDYWCRLKTQSEINAIKDYKLMNTKDVQLWTKARANMEKAAGNKIIQSMMKTAAKNRDKFDRIFEKTNTMITKVKNAKTKVTNLAAQSKRNTVNFVNKSVAKSKQGIAKSKSVTKQLIKNTNTMWNRGFRRVNSVVNTTSTRAKRLVQNSAAVARKNVNTYWNTPVKYVRAKAHTVAKRLTPTKLTSNRVVKSVSAKASNLKSAASQLVRKTLSNMKWFKSKK